MCNARVQRVGEHEIEGSFDTYGRHWGGPENVRVYFAGRSTDSTDGSAHAVIPESTRSKAPPKSPGATRAKR